MSARLASLQFHATEGSLGWTSPHLSFGRILTLALGPNGTGKTPLLKGLVFALGHPVELPPDVRQRCSAVKVTLSYESSTIQIERKVADRSECRVVDADGSVKIFSEEKGFSAWLIGRLGSKRSTDPIYRAAAAPA